MKVLHILNELSFSGAEMMYVSSAKLFKQLGCKLYVVSTSEILGDYSMYFYDVGYVVVQFQYSKSLLGRWDFYQKLSHYIKKEGIDVVHVHRDDVKFIASFCAWFNNIKIICTHHSLYRTHWYSLHYHCIQRWLMTYVFGCIQQSISYSVFVNEKLYFHNETILVNNWYDNQKFFPAVRGEKEYARNKLGISQSSKVVISVGACNDVKRHKDIIEALAFLKQKYPDVCYLHLGDGHKLEEEKSLAKEKGVLNNIIFAGNQLDVRKYLIASDVYVMTSYLEGLSLSTLEAMACGIPTVLYHVPGLCDFNLEMETSIQVEETPEALYVACCEVFDKSNRVYSMVKNAHLLISKRYDMNCNVKQIFELYKV